jgi:hypothetical protein
MRVPAHDVGIRIPVDDEADARFQRKSQRTSFSALVDLPLSDGADGDLTPHTAGT